MRRLRAVGVRHHHEEIRETGIARIERAVVVGVEDIEQRLHVGCGAPVPIGEVDLVRLRELAGAGRIKEQHAVAGGGPGREVLVAVARHVEIGVRRGQLRELDALAGEVEHPGAIS